MSRGARPLSQSIPYIRGIYYFSLVALFSSASWLGFSLGIWLLGRMAREIPHQYSGEVKSPTDSAFPGDSATWLMALLWARPRIACRYNSLPFCLLPVPILRTEMLRTFPKRPPAVSAQYLAPVLSITSPPVLFPLAPLSFFSLWQALQSSALQWVKFLSTVRVLFQKKKKKSDKSAAVEQPKHHFTIYVCAECEQMWIWVCAIL